MFSKKSSSSFVILGFAGALLVALTACETPNAIPTGYVYHDQVYKSPNPPESSKFTELQRTTMGPEQASQFRLAIYSLVDKLTNRAGMPPKPIYVMKPERMTPFYANMDNDLRESLRHIGYRLSDSPESAYVMTYGAAVIPAPKEENTIASSPTSIVPAKIEAKNPLAPNVKMAIHVHDGVGEESRILTQEEGAFYIQGADVMAIPFPTFPGVTTPFLIDENRTAPIQSTKE